MPISPDEIALAIQHALKGATTEKPQSLVNIVAAIDYHLRIAPTLDELTQSLDHLAHSGKLDEIAPGSYVELKAETARSAGSFLGLSQSQLDAAWNSYRDLARRYLARGQRGRKKEKTRPR